VNGAVPVNQGWGVGKTQLLEGVVQRFGGEGRVQASEGILESAGPNDVAVSGVDPFGTALAKREVWTVEDGVVLTPQPVERGILDDGLG
jgi:hypothetical protein